MAKKGKGQSAASKKLWDGIDIDKDFQAALEEVDEVELGDYNTEKMVVFSANVNYARHLLRLSDSLKPVHRRVLFMMYCQALRSGNKKKSISVVGSVTDIHPHGGASVYATMVGLGQYWKMPVPLLKIIGSFGTEVSGIYAADRYTEVTMSDYAWDCFFKDYDPDCVQMIRSTSGNRDEPVSLPSRYPNILINGGSGIAVGNSFRIPPYNITEVIEATTKRLYNRTGQVYLVPDLPTGCDIVDDGESIKRICETGKGTLRMRARITIVDEGKHWGLRIQNLPWGVSHETVWASLVSLTKSGVLPIKEVQDRHEQNILEDGRTVVSPVDTWVIVDKAHDPYAVREKLFKKTKLEESASVNFKVVLESLQLGNFSLAELIDAWIDQRRLYKRRLLNKRISKAAALVETYKIILEVVQPENLMQTMDIIRNSPEDKVAANLVKHYGMSSYQATQIADLPTKTFNANAPAKYARLMKEKQAEIEHLYKMVRSEKKIDEIIELELKELAKWATPRKTQVISDTGTIMDTESEYFLIITKKGCIKKVSVSAVEKSRRGFGTFDQGDFPSNVLRGKNLDPVIFIDSFGRFSVLKIADVPTVTLQEPPMKAYDLLKLEGEIIAMRFFQDEESTKWIRENEKMDMFIVTVSKNGIAKRTSLDSILEQTENGRKTTRNAKICKLKDGDQLAHADYYLSNTGVLIYTARGEYNYVTADLFPEFGRDAAGNQLVKLNDDDECVGACAISSQSKYVVLVTQKGKAKKIEVEYLGIPSPAKSTSYLMDIEQGDTLIYADTPERFIDVCTKFTHFEIPIDDIRTLSRKAKGVKKVPIQPGDNIIQIITH